MFNYSFNSIECNTDPPIISIHRDTPRGIRARIVISAKWQLLLTKFPCERKTRNDPNIRVILKDDEMMMKMSRQKNRCSPACQWTIHEALSLLLTLLFKLYRRVCVYRTMKRVRGVVANYLASPGKDPGINSHRNHKDSRHIWRHLTKDIVSSCNLRSRLIFLLVWLFANLPCS